MLRALIKFCVERRLAVLVTTALIALYGIKSYLDTPIEAYPDVTNYQVNVIAQMPGLAPEEIERQLTIPLREPSLFRQVAHDRRPFNGPAPSDRWLGHVLGRIGRFQSHGIALLPLVAHRETIAIVFGDNPESGREPGNLEPLEVFVQQAGIALENVFLQKKLQAAEDKDRASLR